MPTPKPTSAFASEEEAFAAAEETYRAYIEEVNSAQRDEGGASPHTFLTGEILDSEIQTERELRASGVQIRGDTVIQSFVGVSADYRSSTASIQADVCLDISDVRAIDASGVDVTAPGRSDVYGVTVSFVGSEVSLLLANYEIQVGAKCSS